MGLLFISHSSADNDAALAFGARLRARGFEALFLDFDPEHGIPAGRNWEQELYVQLRRTDAVVFLASPDSVASKWCAVEVSLSRSVGKPVFPIAIRNTPRLPILADTQWIDFAGDGDAAIERLMRALRLAGLDPSDSFVWDGTRSPYPGLNAFAPEDAAVFFGRGSEVGRVLELLHPTLERGSGRFVAVVGPSGSGKSSLVNAGVLPRLAREQRQWTILPGIVPGTRPTAHLARSLGIAFADSGEKRGHAELVQTLTEGPDALVTLADELCDLRDTDALLLVLDQAEELITRTGPAERASFFDLVDGSLHDGSPLWVLATVRSEFLSGSSSDRKIAEIIDDSIVIEPLSRGRMPEVIELPAQRGGIQFAAGLVQRMMEDTVRGDALPLLAYTLLQLYERKPTGGRISHEDYDAVGGVIGALQRRADRVMDDLERRGRRKLALPVLLKLVTIERDGEPTRRRARRATLSKTENGIVDAFLAARLLKADGDGEEATVEVAHEALLRQWRPLRDALEVSRQSIRMRTEVERLSEDWERADRADSYLLRGERLQAAVDWIDDPATDAGAPEREFIDASRAAESTLRAATQLGEKYNYALAILPELIRGVNSVLLAPDADALRSAVLELEYMTCFHAAHLYYRLDLRSVIWHEENGRLRRGKSVGAWVGGYPELDPLRESRLCEGPLRNAEDVWVDDPAAAEHAETVALGPGDKSYPSFLLASMLAGSRNYGLLQLEASGTPPLNAEDVEVVSRLAAMLASGLAVLAQRRAEPA